MLGKDIHKVIGRPKLPSKVVPSLEYEWKVIKDGKVIKSGKGKSHSYVLNFMKIMKLLMLSTATEELTDTGGNAVTVADTDLGAVNVLGGEGDDSKGILFGTGTTAFEITDCKLASKISHGDGDNLLHYNATSVGDIDTSTPSKIRLPIQRSAVNNGSVSINVSEVGLVVSITIGGTDYYFLIARDVLDSAISVPAGATLSWTYYIVTTY